MLIDVYNRLSKIAADTDTVYIVQSGDILGRIARRFNVPLEELARANGIANPDRIRVGQRLIIPRVSSPSAPSAPSEPTAARPPVSSGAESSEQDLPKPDTPSPTPGGEFPEDIQRMYKAIRLAETGPKPRWRGAMGGAPKPVWNPWIRTKQRDVPGGSTAYGPVQLTNRKVSDYFDRYSATMRPSGWLYDTKLSPMYQQFIHWGNVPGAPRRYDYGGEGDPLNWRERSEYQRMAMRMMMVDDSEATGNTPNQRLNNRIRLWRGVGENGDTAKYYNTVRQRYYDPRDGQGAGTDTTLRSK